MAKANLLLLDDHALFRVMLGRLLDTDPDFHVVAHCSAASEALQVLVEECIDLILLDYDLGQRESGFHFIQKARNAGYRGRIFIVTAGMNDVDYVRALGHGICGIFLKHGSPDHLIEAIHRVMTGETWIDPLCIKALVQAVENEGPQGHRNQLSERERRVLEGVFSGLSNKEIGAQLSISEASVKSALQQLFIKTGVRTRGQLVRVALEEYGTAWGLRS